MSKTIIVGGGVIGLSLAYELACRSDRENADRQVVVIDRNRVGERASRAGAGILLPANGATAIHPFDKIEALSNELHETWSQQLRTETGIDTGFRKCGGLYIARTIGEIALLAGTLEHWRQREIEFEELTTEQVQQRFPVVGELANRSDRFKSVFVPGEYQFRNPDHLSALLKACRQRGVVVCDEVGPTKLRIDGGQVTAIESESDSWVGDQYCLTAGPWSAELLRPHAISLPMQPVRGHIVLYKLHEQPLVPIINEGSRYLVPRDDGHVLAGSTIEETDFDDSIVESEIDGLKAWSSSVLPSLDDSSVADRWTGLRPGTFDGFPYMGSLPEVKNAFVSTGHFKAGLQLSPACAVAMADLMLGIKPTVDLGPFAVSRVADAFYSKSTENA